MIAAVGLECWSATTERKRGARTPKILGLNSHGMELMRQFEIVDGLSQVEVPTLVSVGEIRTSDSRCQRIYAPHALLVGRCAGSPQISPFGISCQMAAAVH